MEEEGDYYDDYEILGNEGIIAELSQRQDLLKRLASSMAVVVGREIQEESNFFPEIQRLEHISSKPSSNSELSRVRERILNYGGDDSYALSLKSEVLRMEGHNNESASKRGTDLSQIDVGRSDINETLSLANEIAAIESMESADFCNFNAVAIRKAMSDTLINPKRSKVLDQGTYVDAGIKDGDIRIIVGDNNKRRLVSEYYNGGHFKLVIWADVGFEKRRLLKDIIHRSQQDIDRSHFYLGIMFNGDDRNLFLPILGSFKTDSGCHVVYPNGSELDGEVYNKHEILQATKKLLVNEDIAISDLDKVLDEVTKASVFQADVEEHMKQVRQLVDMSPDFVSGVLQANHYAIPQTLNLDVVGPTELNVIGYLGGVIGRDGKNEIETEFVMTVRTTSSENGQEPSQLIYSVWSGKDPRRYYLDKSKLYKVFELVVDELGNKTLYSVKPESVGADYSVATAGDEEVYIKIKDMLTYSNDNLSREELIKALNDRR